MVERCSSLWNWSRSVFDVNLIIFPVATYGASIQCQEYLVAESSWETLSLFFVFTDQSGTGEKIPKKHHKEREMKPSPAFWYNCIFKITPQPSLLKTGDSKPRIYNDLTYIAGKYDFPIPVAQILLYVFCY